MKFILCGEICSGKDTVAAMLNIPQFAFADQLKLLCRNLRINGVQAAETQVLELCNSGYLPNLLMKLSKRRSIPPVDAKDRQLLQELGSYLRDFNRYIWINPVLHAVEGLQSCCISDCRYSLEFDSFPSFCSIFVDASLENRRSRAELRDGLATQAIFEHPAESQIASLRNRCDYIVENNGNLAELRDSIREIMKEEQSVQGDY
jgi:hypothetical protein